MQLQTTKYGPFAAVFTGAALPPDPVGVGAAVVAGALDGTAGAELDGVTELVGVLEAGALAGDAAGVLAGWWRPLPPLRCSTW